MATNQFRARYRGGVFEPLEEVDLRDGCEVVVTVEISPRAPDQSADPADVNQQPLARRRNYPNYVKWILDEQANWPPEELEGPPSDLAKNKKHYLYGYPKEEDE